MTVGQTLVFDGMTKRFGSVVAVDDLDFTVEPGRVTGFLGPNGAGKTTTLRMLLGLVTATSGTATIGGRRTRQLEDPMRVVGASLEAAFHPGRSGRDHLDVVATAAGIPRERVGAVLELTGIGALRRPPCGRLLHGDAAAARARDGAARRPRGARARRADQRPRPRRHPLDPLLPAGARRRGPHDAGLVPPAQRGAADG